MVTIHYYSCVFGRRNYRGRLTYIKIFLSNESVCHFMIVQLFKLSTKEIEDLSWSLCVRAGVCVCVFLYDNSKRNGSRNMNLDTL